jgi:hypothetical protein
MKRKEIDWFQVADVVKITGQQKESVSKHMVIIG